MDDAAKLFEVKDTKIVKIFEGQDFYVPRFEVKIGKQKLALNIVRDITEVTYHDDIQQVDNFDITIFNEWEHGRQRPSDWGTSSSRKDDELQKVGAFKYSDEQIFDPGQIVELSMGYMGQDLRKMITGEINTLKPSFPSSGQSMLAVSGLNTLNRLTRKKQESHSYEKKNDVQIAREIAQRLQMDLEVPADLEKSLPVHDYVFQDNQFDIVFLTERARRINCEIWIDEDKPKPVLLFKPSDNVRDTAYELHYGSSLMQFNPTLTTINQVEKVTVRGWDNKTKKPITGVAIRADLKTKGVGKKGRQSEIDKSLKGYEEVITDKPIHSKKEADHYAQETLEKIAKGLVKGSGSTLGLPKLRAGTRVLLTGLGERFSGMYFITSTTHTINDSGYTTSFECRREEK